MAKYQIKISGIDKNQDKHKWLDINDISYMEISNNVRLNPPSKGTYSNLVKICRRMGLKDRESHLFFDLLSDEDFEKKVKSKISNADWRKLGLGEKKLRKNKIYYSKSISTLEDWS